MNSNGQHPAAVRKDWADLPEWITVDEAAEQSGYNPQHIRRLARKGKIGAEKKGGRDWWINPDKFRAYLATMADLGAKKYDPRGLPQDSE